VSTLYALQQVQLTLPKLGYAALNMLGVGMALYKCASLGLLPVTSADWTSYLPPKTMMEHSGSPLPW
jgi:ER membrane protein complex subunit 4